MTRTSESALRYYDKIDLLSPVHRGENKYRYYTISQLALCNTIRTLQNAGVTLAEIKELKEKRTPEIIKSVLTRQVEDLNDRRDKLGEAVKLLRTLLRSIYSGQEAETNIIKIEYKITIVLIAILSVKINKIAHIANETANETKKNKTRS